MCPAHVTSSVCDTHSIHATSVQKLMCCSRTSQPCTCVHRETRWLRLLLLLLCDRPAWHTTPRSSAWNRTPCFQRVSVHFHSLIRHSHRTLTDDDHRNVWHCIIATCDMKQACDLQACLQRMNWNQDKCTEYIALWNTCCDKVTASSSTSSYKSPAAGTSTTTSPPVPAAKDKTQ